MKRFYLCVFDTFVGGGYMVLQEKRTQVLERIILSGFCHLASDFTATSFVI